MNHSYRTWSPLLALGLFLLLLGACGESRSPFVGTYTSTEPFAGKGHITLVLKDTGEATWTMEGDGQALKFKWRVQEGRIWLYTKEGGILIVTPSQDGKTLSADMTGEWNPGSPPDQCVTFSRAPGNK